MAWIKRNLFFVVGGGLALLLLGGAGFYIYTGLTRNATAFDKLNEIYGTLQNLAHQKPAPGNDKVNNTQIAKDQEKQVRDWINQAGNHFEPIPAIPATGSVTSRDYAASLRGTIDHLQRVADNAGVLLPPKYSFSFDEQMTLMKFAEGSLDPLATQLGEVKAISEIIFAARVNSLDAIQRVRVSDDDATGPQSNYLDEHPVTNDLGVLTPYVITFRSFTPELARVLAGFATASNAFIVKSLNVQPAGEAAELPADATAGAPGGVPPMMRMPGEFAPPAAPPPMAGKAGQPTILKEQLLRITLEVELVKLSPKS
jgi:hypothetical protein